MGWNKTFQELKEFVTTGHSFLKNLQPMHFQEEATPTQKEGAAHKRGRWVRKLALAIAVGCRGERGRRRNTRGWRRQGEEWWPRGFSEFSVHGGKAETLTNFVNCTDTNFKFMCKNYRQENAQLPNQWEWRRSGMKNLISQMEGRNKRVRVT